MKLSNFCALFYISGVISVVLDLKPKAGPMLSFPRVEKEKSNLVNLKSKPPQSLKTSRKNVGKRFNWRISAKLSGSEVSDDNQPAANKKSLAVFQNMKSDFIQALEHASTGLAAILANSTDTALNQRVDNLLFDTRACLNAFQFVTLDFQLENIVRFFPFGNEIFDAIRDLKMELGTEINPHLEARFSLAIKSYEKAKMHLARLEKLPSISEHPFTPSTVSVEVINRVDQFKAMKAHLHLFMRLAGSNLILVEKLLAGENHQTQILLLNDLQVCDQGLTALSSYSNLKQIYIITNSTSKIMMGFTHFQESLIEQKILHTALDTFFHARDEFQSALNLLSELESVFMKYEDDLFKKNNYNVDFMNNLELYKELFGRFDAQCTHVFTRIQPLIFNGSIPEIHDSEQIFSAIHWISGTTKKLIREIENNNKPPNLLQVEKLYNSVMDLITHLESIFSSKKWRESSLHLELNALKSQMIVISENDKFQEYIRKTAFE